MRICVATDLSPTADAALRLALDWAQRFAGACVLLHVVHDPELAPALSGDVPGDVQRATLELQRIAQAAPVPCSVDVRTADDVATGIAEAARDADYLFVGAQGKSALQRLRLGSIATALLRRVHVPVVCCPPPVADA